MKRTTIIAGLALVLMGACPAPGQQSLTDSIKTTTVFESFDNPINPDLYLIRPGERLVVTPIKAGLAPSELVVGPEGKIIDARIGVIDVTGMTLTEVRKRLEEPLAGQYRSSQIIVSISAPRRISITVTGAVAHPGSYVMSTSQRVSEAINRAGGLKPGSSTRLIEFTGGPKPLTVDLDRLKYGRDGNADLPLYAGTTIQVPLRSTQSVRVVGEVVSPREIEFVCGDTREELIMLAGGVLPSGDADKCYRWNDSQRPEADLVPQNGDLLVVPISQELLARHGVVVTGAVRQPGGYKFHDGLTFAELLETSGGGLPSSVVSRSVIFRRNGRMEPGSDTASLTPISNLFDLSGKPRSVNLMPLDSVYVPASIGVVKISGLVRRPGAFPYEKGRSVSEYIGGAGGLASSTGRVDVSVRNRITGQVFLAAMESIVEDGDEVLVSSAEGRP